MYVTMCLYIYAHVWMQHIPQADSIRRPPTGAGIGATSSRLQPKPTRADLRLTTPLACNHKTTSIILSLFYTTKLKPPTHLPHSCLLSSSPRNFTRSITRSYSHHPWIYSPSLTISLCRALLLMMLLQLSSSRANLPNLTLGLTSFHAN